MSTHEIEASALLEILSAKEPCKLIDVREPSEIVRAAFPGAINISFADLPHSLGRLQKDEKIVMICHHGIRSLQACLFLRYHGFQDVKSLKGGIENWSRTIDSSIPTY